MKLKYTIILLLFGLVIIHAQNSPVAKWNFNDGNLNDEVEGLEAELEGSQISTGYVNAGLLTKGYDELTTVDDADVLDLSEEGTIALWSKIYEHLPYGGLVHKGRKKNFKDEAYTFQFWDNGKTLTAAVVNDDEESSVLHSDTDIETNNWYFAVMSWNEEVLRIYLNGSLDSEMENEAGEARNTKGSMQIGSQLTQKYNNELQHFGLNGTVDEVALFNEFFDEDDASELFESYSEEDDGGLVSHWNFNEGEGDAVNDNAGENEGSIQNGADWTQGVDASALQFDGEDDFVSVEDADNLNPEDAITLEAWVKWNTNPAEGNNHAAIINKGGDNQYLLHHSDDNEHFEFAIETEDSRQFVHSVTSPAPNVWYYVVGTYSKDHKKMSIYVNGVKEASKYQNEEILESDNDLNIGRHTEFFRYFNGIIDEVRIHDKLLTGEAINERYLELKPEEDEEPPEMYVHFKMDSGEGETIVDNTGEIFGSLINTPEWVDGKSNYGLKFNGENQFVHFENSSEFPVTDEITLMAWAKAEENKTAKVLQKGDWDGYSLGQDKHQGWQATVSIGEEAHDIEWNHNKPILGEWYHLAVTYTGTQIQFYVNGELQGVKDIEGDLRENERDFYLGTDEGDQKFFNGSVDGIKAMNFTLSGEEIAADYNSYENNEDGGGDDEEDQIWQTLDVQGMVSFPYSFDINSEGTIFSGNWGGAGIFRSEDQGMSWNNLVSGYWVWTIAIDNDDNIFAGTTSRGLIKSTDNGDSWIEVETGVDDADYRDVIVDGDNIYLSGWGTGVLRSTNNGETWEPINNGLTSNVIHSITMDNEGNLLAGAYDGAGLFKSTDQGDSWESIPVPYGYIWAVDVHPNGDIYLGTYGSSDFNDELGLYVSKDNGTTWNKDDFFDGMNIYGFQFVENDIFVMTWENGIYQTRNTAPGSNMVNSWMPFNSGVMSGGVSAMIVLDNNRLLLATDDGQMYGSDNNLITNVGSSKDMNSMPSEYRLDQNYPNPFNPSTTISYEISKPGFVTLKVYDILGNEVANLVNEYKTPGYYNYRLNTADHQLSTGIYMYELNVNGFRSVKKMVLMK